MENELRALNIRALSHYKRIFRAIRRGHVTPSGLIIPKRPFNNRANTSARKGINSRFLQEEKKRLYGRYKTGIIN